MSCSISSPREENWDEIIEYKSTRNIAETVCFKSFVALAGREDGLTRLWLMDRRKNGQFVPASLTRVEFHEELYEVEIGANKVFDTDFLRFRYSSLTTPARDMDLDTRKQHGWKVDAP